MCVQRDNAKHYLQTIRGAPMDTKMTPRSPNPVDIHVGSRVRLRRQLLRLSQEKLGDALGVTFQQVQKYERGTNRVGASRLHRMSQILEVPVGFFFEGIDDDAAPEDLLKDDNTPVVYEFINSTDGVSMATSMSKITDPRVRRRLLELVRALASENED